MLNRERTVSWGIFLFSLSIVAISSISIIYPALVVITMAGSESNTNPFERGIWAIPFIIINLVLLDFAILYYYKKLPDYVVRGINFLLSFEISRKVAFVVVVVIISGYVVSSFHELSQIESEQWPDYVVRIEPTLEEFPQSFFLNQSLVQKLIVKNFLLVASIEIFENVKVLPFIASASLLLLTYLFTAKISEKRFAGVLSLIVLVQSRTFLDFDSTATYSNFWVLFYLLSLYLVYKKWQFSAPVYILSILCKPITLLFLPLTLFFIYKADISKNRKIFTVITYLAIVLLITGAALIIGLPKDYYLEYDNSEFWTGFTAWVFQLRYDAVLLILLLPLTVGLFLLSRRGVFMADALLILIAVTLLAAPLLGGLTGFNVHPYRFIPLIVFFAVGIGLLFGKRSNFGS